MRSCRRALLELCVVALVASCHGDDAPPAAGEPETTPAVDALAIEIVDVDVARQPRDERPFVAGEVARLELGVRGGQPPYEVAIASEPPGLVTATLRAEPAAGDASGVVVAGQVTLDARARSGDYRLIAVARGRGGESERARSEAVPVVGDGAKLAPAPSAAPFVEIVDAGGRRRASFHRGEGVTVRARLGDQRGTAAVTVSAPDGTALATTEIPLGDDGSLALPFAVPALALPGDYQVEVRAGRGRGRAVLKVDDPPFSPVGSLAIDELRLSGGDDGRSPRAAELRRGEDLVVRVRVGGVDSAVGGSVRLRDRRGRLVMEHDLAEVRATARHPSARLHLRHHLRVPADVPPGRYMLEIEAREDDLLSTTYRDVVLR